MKVQVQYLTIFNVLYTFVYMKTGFLHIYVLYYSIYKYFHVFFNPQCPVCSSGEEPYEDVNEEDNLEGDEAEGEENTEQDEEEGDEEEGDEENSET